MRDWPSGVTRRFSVAVFLDRDGTINEDTHYTHQPEEMAFVPGAIDGLALLAALPLHVIVVTNQAGIALGLYPRETMSAFNAELRRRIEESGGRIDAFYYCPHKEMKHLEPGEAPCACSKPSPGMLFEAAADFGLDLTRSYLIGDKSSDVVAGQAAGCRTVLLSTGKAGREEGAVAVRPDRVAASLVEAVRWVDTKESRVAGETSAMSALNRAE